MFLTIFPWAIAVIAGIVAVWQWRAQGPLLDTIEEMTRQLRGYIKITHPGKKVSKTVVDESLKNLEAAYADAACKDAAYKVLDALGLEYDAANNKWIKVRKEVRECKITCEEEGSAGSTGVDDSGGSKKKTWRNRYTSGS